MTACVIFSPSLASASAFILDKIIAEISGGENVLRWPLTSTCIPPWLRFQLDPFIVFEPTVQVTFALMFDTITAELTTAHDKLSHLRRFL